MTTKKPPELILRGDVFTVDPRRSWAEALAVRDGRILAVGSANEVDALAGAGTQTVDLPGQLILPGFQDSHVHPPHAGLERMRCDLNEARGPDDYAPTIRAYTTSHPDEP